MKTLYFSTHAPDCTDTQHALNSWNFSGAMQLTVHVDMAAFLLQSMGRKKLKIVQPISDLCLHATQLLYHGGQSNLHPVVVCLVYFWVDGHSHLQNLPTHPHSNGPLLYSAVICAQVVFQWISIMVPWLPDDLRPNYKSSNLIFFLYTSMHSNHQT